MDTSSSAATIRGGRSLQNISPTPSRKEWRPVSDSLNVGESTDYVDLEQLNLSRTIERTIYENERETEDFSNSELLQQRILTVSRQKGELEQLEIELRAQMMARHRIIEIQNNYESQFTEYANAAARMQEQLHEKEKSIREAETNLEEKDRELHAIKLDNEEAWAKEGILREQNKELATFRRERDHFDVERSQNIHKITELQEHIQEKETQLSELQEQNRIAQETISYKDDQLREAQGWIARAQEMDALHSSTNHSLRAELQERTDQYNQLWFHCQRQFGETERLHSHTVQQLQLQLVNVKEGGGSNTNSSGVSQIIQKSGNQFEARGNSTGIANINVHPNGKSSDNISSLNKATQSNRVDGFSSSTPGTHVYLQAGQMNPLNSFVMHQQEISQLVQPQIPSPHAQSVTLQQKAVQNSSQMPMQNHVPPPQGAHGLVTSDARSEYEVAANGQYLGQGYEDAQTSQGAQYGTNTLSFSVHEQAGNGDYIGSNQSESNFQDISLQVRDALRLDSHTLNQKPGVANGQVSPGEQNGAKSIVPETLVSSGKADDRNSGSALLDERSLLACVLRTIPAGGSIRISSTLPNRLEKMLAPLHWHDYKNKYGKLEDFVASHLELFAVEGDYIQVREGAQKLVAASAAAAKVAAAAAAASSSPNSNYVAMTPMAQSLGSKKNDKAVQRGRQSSGFMATQQRKL